MKKLTDKEIRNMILNLIQEIDCDIWNDYDIWKSFTKLSEDPEEIEDKMINLVTIVKTHLEI